MTHKKYHINAEELISILYHKHNNKRLGFSEDAIKKAESTLDVKIPDVYRSFLLHSGNAEKIGRASCRERVLSHV